MHACFCVLAMKMKNCEMNFSFFCIIIRFHIFKYIIWLFIIKYRESCELWFTLLLYMLNIHAMEV